MLQPADHSLVAIVSLDLHGYSRLMELDERGTHRALMACWQERLAPIVRDHDGLIVKFTGDGALISLPNASAALGAMISFQQAVGVAEQGFPASRRLVFRIGIHLSPMICEGGDVYGHGVNLAVRLQEAALPGSIMLSGAAAAHLDPETAPPLDDLGWRRFKNIDARTRVRRWRDRTKPPAVVPRRLAIRRIAAVLLMGLFMPVANSGDGAAPNRHQPTLSVVTAVAGEHHSLEPDEAADSRTIVAASHAPPFRTPPQAGHVHSTMAAAERSLERRAEIAEDAYLQARAHYARHTPDAFAKALDELDQALRYQSDDSAAHTLTAAVYWGAFQNRWHLGRGFARRHMLHKVEHHLARANEPDPVHHMVTSEMLTASGRHDRAIEEARRAITLAPDRAVGHYAEGRALLFAGHADLARQAIRTAIRLDPHAPRYLFGLALAQFGMDSFDDAARTLERAILRNGDDDWPHLLLAATLGHRGSKAAARQAIGRFDRLSLRRRGWFASQIPYVHSWPFQDDEDRNRFHQGMVLAGIVAWPPHGRRTVFEERAWYSRGMRAFVGLGFGAFSCRLRSCPTSFSRDLSIPRAVSSIGSHAFSLQFRSLGSKTSLIGMTNGGGPIHADRRQYRAETLCSRWPGRRSL